MRKLVKLSAEIAQQGPRQRGVTPLGLATKSFGYSGC
jgi:hypothetical protein